MSSTTPQKLVENDENNGYYRLHIVWLDKNLDTRNNQETLEALNYFDGDMKTFKSKDKCINYIEQQNDRNTNSYIIFIISGSLSEQIIPKIQDYNCILTIFIFCGSIENYKHLNYKRLEAICDDSKDLNDKVARFIKANDETHISLFPNQDSTHSDAITLKSDSKDQHSIRNLKEDQARFLWFYHCHNFMIELENDDNERAKQEMIAHCRKEFPDEKTQSRIDHFNRESLKRNAKNAIRWYTDDSFMYKCTNKMLRRENISQIYSYRYIIKLLCRQLKELHKQFILEYKTVGQDSSLQVYRGVFLSSSDILLLNRNVNNLISFNGFVSTARDKNVAKVFIKKRPRHEGHEPVLIEIDIDMTKEHDIPFADISKFSNYSDELEVLFSIGAVFRVKSVEFNEKKKFYVVHLSLDQHDQLNVNNYMQHTYAKHVDTNDRSVLFGKLLCDMGEYESAIKYFLDLLDNSLNLKNDSRAVYLNNIGVCYNEMKNTDQALKYYKEACKIYEQTNNERGISTCQHNIASIYHSQGDNEKASQLALEALDFRQSDKIDKASTLNLLGCIRLARRENEAAFNNFQESLQLRVKYLGKTNPYHPDIGVSHQNLGKIHFQQFNYINAETNLLRAAEIFRHNFPISHPFMKGINECLEQTRQQLT
ncbi:unnamed protein product [Adineta steineri]|uniref:ADP ribosyltransferase domain-containing protein n=1 Tax=Adineta steineri TaxID=433720 RepID=A0A814TL56_9BILA|nr:unnamed protein product [Adineta steineri]CAF3704428.1 unnamed protein product [Adineta steineri]